MSVGSRRQKIRDISEALKVRGYNVTIDIKTEDITRVFFKVSKDGTEIYERVFLSASIMWTIEYLIRTHETQYEKEHFRELSVVYK